MTHGNFDTEKVSVTFSCVRIFYFSRKLQSGNDLINACFLGCSLRACQFGAAQAVKQAQDWGGETDWEKEGEMQTTPRTRPGFLSFYMGFHIHIFTFGSFSAFAFNTHPWPCTAAKTVNCNLSSPYMIRLTVYALSIQLFSLPNFIIKMLDECRITVTVMHSGENTSLNLNLPPSLSLARATHDVFAGKLQPFSPTNIRL